MYLTTREEEYMYTINVKDQSIEIIIGNTMIPIENREIRYITNVKYNSYIEYVKAHQNSKTKNIEELLFKRLKKEIPGIPLDAYKDIIYIIINNAAISTEETSIVDPDINATVNIEPTVIDEDLVEEIVEEMQVEETFPEPAKEEEEKPAEPTVKEEPKPIPKRRSRSRKKTPNKNKSS